MKEVLTITIPPELKEHLKDACSDLGVKQSHLVNLGIELVLALLEEDQTN